MRTLAFAAVSFVAAAAAAAADDVLLDGFRVEVRLLVVVVVEGSVCGSVEVAWLAGSCCCCYCCCL